MTRILIAFFLLAQPVLALADVTVSWNANIESDLAGYRVYYGTAPNFYERSVYVGNVTSVILPVCGDSASDYFYAVTAIDFAGNESGFSEEVSLFIADVVTCGYEPELNGGVDTRFTAKQNVSLVYDEPTVPTPDSAANWVNDWDVLDVTVDGAFVDWGDWNAEHTYSIMLVGAAREVVFQISDSYYPDNSGFLKISVFGESTTVNSNIFADGRETRVFIPEGEVVTVQVSGTYIYWGTENKKSDAEYRVQ